MQRNPRPFAACRRMLGLAAVVAAGVMAACSDSSTPTAVHASQSVAPQSVMDRGGNGAQNGSGVQNGASQASPVSALLRDYALGAPITVSKVISRNGGTINIPATDFQLRIPRGAFNADTMTITVTALAGSTVAYAFEPHGTVFNVPLTFVQHLGHTRLKGKPAPGLLSQLEGAYFPDVGLVDPTTGEAVVTETLPTSVEATFLDDVVTFPIHHFSGYLISTGRR